MRAWADRGRTLPGRHDPEWVRLSAPSAMYGYGTFGATQDPRGEPRFVPVRDPRADAPFNASRDPRNEFGVTPDRRGDYGMTPPDRRGEFGATPTDRRSEYGVGPDPQDGAGTHRGPRGDLGAGLDTRGAVR